jgi:hypothetical protein
VLSYQGSDLLFDIGVIVVIDTIDLVKVDAMKVGESKAGNR